MQALPDALTKDKACIEDRDAGMSPHAGQS
jgi:hypothetical protein